MFSIPRVNVIESDEGFAVEVMGRTGIRYTERPKTASLDSEVLMGPSGLVIWPSSIATWDPPGVGAAIDDATRRRIVDNIRRAFRFSGFEIEVQ